MDRLRFRDVAVDWLGLKLLGSEKLCGDCVAAMMITLPSLGKCQVPIVVLMDLRVGRSPGRRCRGRDQKFKFQCEERWLTRLTVQLYRPIDDQMEGSRMPCDEENS